MSKHLEALEAVYFPVRRIDRSEQNPSLLYNSPVSHEIQVRPNMREPWVVVNNCSKDYTLVKNSELFPPLVEKIKEAVGDNFEAIVKVYDNCKFYVDFIFKGKLLSSKKDPDKVIPRMRVNNSYDGSLKYSYHFGFYRLVCSNGLMIPVKGKARGQKLMHTPYAADDRALKDTVKHLQEFLDNMGEYYEAYNTLKEVKYRSLEAAIEKLREVAEEIDDYPKGMVEHAVNQLSREASQFPITNFLVYNALNYALYQSPESTMKTHKRDKIDIKVLDYLLEN